MAVGSRSLAAAMLWAVAVAALAGAGGALGACTPSGGACVPCPSAELQVEYCLATGMKQPVDCVDDAGVSRPWFVSCGSGHGAPSSGSLIVFQAVMLCCFVAAWVVVLLRRRLHRRELYERISRQVGASSLVMPR